MSQLQQVKQHLNPGRVYRRADLAQWSNAVDRHLQQLQRDGTLTKLSGGLYYYPRKTAFGAAPADDETLIATFLKDHRFLLSSPNAYNALGLGTTQLYNETIVYNHKRHGKFTLGGRSFDFRVKPHFPEKLSEEFLVIDLLNNLEQLAEDHDAVLDRIKQKITAMNQGTLKQAARLYGGVRARKFFAEALKDATVHHAA